MQDYIRNGRKQATYNPDLLLRGKGVGWGESSKWYRQTGDDGGRVPLIAKFRPSGWSKTYEYELTFNDRGHNSDDITLKINRIDDKNNVYSSRKIIGLKTEVVQKSCPFCSHLIIMVDENKRWKCTENTCQFNYTSDTCKLMYEEFGSDPKMNTQRRFQNFGNLQTLTAESDMMVNINKYQL